MKKLLWKPSRLSWHIHVVIAMLSIILLIGVEVFKKEKKNPSYNERIQAAHIMKEAIDKIKKYRIKKNLLIDPRVDPTLSGLMGLRTSEVTSVKGEYEAKRATLNPNWAAVLVDMLQKAKVKKGDTICVAFSGSFPAMNIAILSAAKALDLKVVIISSAAASSWGANIPSFLWLDMENLLYRKKIIPYRSVAASLGGIKDNATGISDYGKTILINAITRKKIELINIDDIHKNIDRRIEIYSQNLGDRKAAAFINSGGGTITVGSTAGKKSFHPGLNRRVSVKALKIDSVMTRFAKQGIPVIHITQILKLADKYGLPKSFNSMPVIGRGTVYKSKSYNNIIVIASLAVIFLALYILVKEGKGYTLFLSKGKKKSEATSPEHMV
jgi:poly-gamma-glutamate system protein